MEGTAGADGTDIASTGGGGRRGGGGGEASILLQCNAIVHIQDLLHAMLKWSYYCHAHAFN